MAAAVLDSYALLAFLRGEDAHGNVRELLDRASDRDQPLHMTEVNYAEVKYIIVRKEKSLKSIGKKCDELACLELYQTAYSHQQKEVQGKEIVQRKASWFNNVDAGDDCQINVLRFEEEILNQTGSIDSLYKGEWLCSQRLSKERCFRYAKRGRMRWDQEDFHNTCKNRGFDIKHDMVRTNSNLLLVWKMLMFIAFFVFELFSLSVLGKTARGKRSLMKFAKDMLAQL